MSEQQTQAATERIDIYLAISTIQSELPVLEKTAKNPHFGSTFTPLDDVVKRLYPLLRAQGVVCCQPIMESSQPGAVRVHTILRHIHSGTQVESVCELSGDAPNKSMNKQQAQGSAISYARRYSLTSLLGIVCGNEDDDGNAAGQPVSQAPQVQAKSNEAEELERFKVWLKKLAPSKEQAEALCQWLASSEMPGLTLKDALSQVHVARCVGRTIKKIQSVDGVTTEIMMANAMDFAKN